jgi:hypothetical protein
VVFFLEAVADSPIDAGIQAPVSPPSVHFFKSRLPKRGFWKMTQSQPTITPKLEDPKFGFNEYAERLNGRAAMIGFLLMVVIEYSTNQGVLSWLGLK